MIGHAVAALLAGLFVWTCFDVAAISRGMKICAEQRQHLWRDGQCQRCRRRLPR